MFMYSVCGYFCRCGIPVCLHWVELYHNCTGEQETMADGSGNVLRLLSWNIDGLDEEDKTERTEEVCRIVLLKRPHVVFLQEVVADTQAIILEKLGRLYSLYVHPVPPLHYYPMILINKRCGDLSVSGILEVFEFPDSSMGRHLLQLPVSFYGVSFRLFTSHLESTKNCAIERRCQLELCFSEVQKHTQQGKVCLFGGDLNVRDQEVKVTPPPEKVVDVWQACGSVLEEKFTWDTTVNTNLSWEHQYKPKMRFDRLYLSPSDSVSVQPMKFELVGKDCIPECKRFPSDHWGMWAEFSIHQVRVTTV